MELCEIPCTQGPAEGVKLPPALPASHIDADSCPLVFTLLHANVPGKAEQADSMLGRLLPTWEVRKKLVTLAWPTPAHCNQLGSELVDRRQLTLTLLSFPHFNCAFQINKYIKLYQKRK